MPGQMVHIEIPVDDAEKGREFWGGLFGWEFQAYPEGSDYHMTQLSEQSGAAVSREPGKRGTRTYFDVDDIDTGVARVQELGGSSDQAQPVPGMGWFAICRDPEGNEFGLWQHDPSAQPPAG